MWSLILCVLGLTQFISASAFTFILGANQNHVIIFSLKTKSSIRYYFAVQSGGSFDVDYEIVDPNGNKVVSDSKQRQGDFVFNADFVGEYEFCFSNTMSTFAEKVIDFEIKFENEDNAENLEQIYQINPMLNH